MKYMDYMMMRDGRRLPPRNSRGEFRRRDREYEDEDYEYDERGRDERGRDRRSGSYDRESYDRVRGGGRGSNSRGGGSRGGDRHYDDYESYYEMEYNDVMQLDRRTIRDWEEHLENADGSRGPKFTKEQIIATAEQHGYKMRNYTEDELCMTVNMFYSDYCKVIGNDINLYIKLAHAFLEDPDAALKGGEKLAAYYYCIVEG